MKYNKLIVISAFLAGLCFCAHYPFPSLAGNSIYAGLRVFLIYMLWHTIGLKMCFDFILKKYMCDENHKKASIIAYISTIIYNLFEAVKHIVFSEVNEYSVPLIPLLFPIWLIIFFSFIFKSQKISSNKIKIATTVILSAITAFSLFCEINIFYDFMAQL